LLIDDLCKYLKDAILIKINSDENWIKFFYRDSIITYNTKFHNIQKEDSKIFNFLPEGSNYKKYIEDVIVDFIFEKQTIQFNFGTLLLIEIKRIEIKNIEVKSESLIKNQESFDSGYFIAGLTFGGLLTFVIAICIIIIKKLIKKYSPIPLSDGIEKILGEAIQSSTSENKKINDFRVKDELKAKEEEMKMLEDLNEEAYKPTTERVPRPLA